MAGGGVSAVVCVLLFKSSEVSLRAPFVRLGAPLPITPVAGRDQLSVLLDGQGDEALCRQARNIAEARAQSLGLRGTRHLMRHRAVNHRWVHQLFWKQLKILERRCPSLAEVVRHFQTDLSQNS